MYVCGVCGDDKRNFMIRTCLKYDAKRSVWRRLYEISVLVHPQKWVRCWACTCITKFIFYVLFIVSETIKIAILPRLFCLVLEARVFAGRQKSLEMATSKNHVLKLYKTMLRESQKFSSYNYRLLLMLLLLNCIVIVNFKKNVVVWLCLLDG